MKKIIHKFLQVSKVNTESFDSQNILTHRFAGNVTVETVDNSTIIFNELITRDNGTEIIMNSKNIYRWTFLPSGNIKLEHLRFGTDKPVFLVELSQTEKNIWKSIEPHNCNNDLYYAELDLSSEKPVLYWAVKGPAENYSLKTVYSY